ncbi:hypothetical protein HZS_5212, partial [Henneguya salminicola]
MLLTVALLFICSSFSDVIKHLKGKDVEDWADGEKFSVLLIQDKEGKQGLKCFENLAKVFEGYISIGIVKNDDKLPSKYISAKFPAVKIIHNKGKTITDYTGQIVCQELGPHILDLITEKLKGNIKDQGCSPPSSYVVPLGDSNFTELIQNSEHHYLVEFFAPWCGHCKNLAPHWEKAAKELKNQMKLAAVDATVSRSLAEKFGIQGFPTIKFFPAGTKDLSKAADYNGGRTADEIVNWANSMLQSLVPPPECVQAYDQSILDKHCFSKVLCFIVFLPTKFNADSSTWKKYLNSIDEAINLVPSSNFGWVWLEGATNEDFDKAFGIGESSYPAL